jgi:hypothetical protein
VALDAVLRHRPVRDAAMLVHYRRVLRLPDLGRVMVNGRNKGAQFEREIANMLFFELGISFKRDLRQYQEAATAT